MQKIATKIFIVASVVFGVLGIAMMFTGGPDKGGIIPQLFFSTVFVILPSFALSVAGKYLNSK